MYINRASDYIIILYTSCDRSISYTASKFLIYIYIYIADSFVVKPLCKKKEQYPCQREIYPKKNITFALKYPHTYSSLCILYAWYLKIEFARTLQFQYSRKSIIRKERRAMVTSRHSLGMIDICIYKKKRHTRIRNALLSLLSLFYAFIYVYTPELRHAYIEEARAVRRIRRAKSINLFSLFAPQTRAYILCSISFASSRSRDESCVFVDSFLFFYFTCFAHRCTHEHHAWSFQ